MPLNKHVAAILSGVLWVVNVHAQSVDFRIDANELLRPINPFLYGINTARWDESLFPGPTDEMLLRSDRDAISKIEASGITLLKYPGGNDADAYIWNSPDNNASEMDTDEYIALCREVGAEPFITVNFNAGPELAAAWVRYCNTERGYNVRYWEVGDEQWGTWAKGHAPPEVYAEKYVAFVEAMRDVDPTIKVATNVPLGPHPEQWTTRVLKAAGDHVDLLTYTFFPQKWGSEHDDSLLASVNVFRGLVKTLRSDVEQALGKERAASLLTVNVGYNSVNHSPGPQTLEVVNALWTARMLGAMAEAGTDIACYWALHNAFPPRKGDYGYLSSEGLNTPSYTYYVFPMFAHHAGQNLIATSGGSSEVSLTATRSGKMLGLFFVNASKTAESSVSLSLQNFEPHPNIRAWILDEKRGNQPFDAVSVRGSRLALTLPPYSLVAVTVLRADSTLPPVNLAQDAQATASSFATIGPHFGPESAVDGKPYTRWNSAAWTKSGGQEEQWYQLTWERPVRLGRVRINWGESFATDYRLMVSPDGVTWIEVAREEDASGGISELQFPPREVRAVRMLGKRGSQGISAYSIREFAAFE